ncbi:MAG TPA: UDP-N-acetylmuramate dehydrogenase [Fimbriimonadaceae bacterium]|nr:UDP-N-acetylmuramate dehydrogenase [Fimbriimonadaceae bacterium]
MDWGALMNHLVAGQPLRSMTTLKAGGPAEWFAVAPTKGILAELSRAAHQGKIPLTILGWGSNLLPADAGVRGLVVWNRARKMVISRTGEVEFDTGCGFQDVFLRCAQAGLRGLEYAVGIPGTLGGALVSNAGAYRSQVSEFITELEVIEEGELKWVPPSHLQFSYRDSILRRPVPPPLVVLSVRMQLPAGDPHAIYAEARDYQRQRISKQPPPASAGSFFKNVNDPDLAHRLPSLPPALREAGVVPSGYLIQEAGLQGYRHEGAMLSRRHANFIVNTGSASATAIRQLADIAKTTVRGQFGVELEEEVLMIGDWTGYQPATFMP